MKCKKPKKAKFTINQVVVDNSPLRNPLRKIHTAVHFKEGWYYWFYDQREEFGVDGTPERKLRALTKTEVHGRKR